MRAGVFPAALSYSFTHQVPSHHHGCSLCPPGLSPYFKLGFLVLLRNNWPNTTVIELIFSLNTVTVLKTPYMLLHQWTLENTLTAAKPPCPWLKQMAMKWSSAVLVITVTSYITRATQMPPTIYDFSYKMAHLVTMDPNWEDQKLIMKNAPKFLRCRSSKMKSGLCSTLLQQYASN